MVMPSISVVIPALNEEKAIAQTIKAIPLKHNDEIIVIDNGSTDGTYELASLCGARVIKEPRKGYGQALRTGFVNAQNDIIVTCDADATYPVDKIPSLVGFLVSEKLEFMTTNRFAYCVDGSMSDRNKLGNDIITNFMNIIYGMSLGDSQSGMWIFKRDILDKLRIKSWTNTLSQEIKIEAIHYCKVRWYEHPIEYHERVGDSQLYGSNYKAIKGGTKLLLHLFKKYIWR